ncbi:hypothetical protein [Phyllobacterium meliloti]|uniref:hypothetical protein n=1 Tax=Phyllobacterium meliloti TaxID=555317 RepID=UPI001D140A83|nr:hypothetical protein [Phyllobacterium sp. T1293]UGX87394.1 hypothetical protein LLE53_006060 [Phyllobacterium sp. T1293]
MMATTCTERTIPMASTDYTTTHNARASAFQRIFKDKDRAILALIFAGAFAFHLAVLFNLLPA